MWNNIPQLFVICLLNDTICFCGNKNVLRKTKSFADFYLLHIQYSFSLTVRTQTHAREWSWSVCVIRHQHPRITSTVFTSEPGLGVASDGGFAWRGLPVCKYETIGRQRAVWSLSFSVFHWANLSTVHARLVSLHRGQNVNTASAHSME